MDTENDFENNNIVRIFINILDDFDWLIDKALHSVKSEIFSIKLWRKLTKSYPMTIMKMKYNFSETIFHVLGYWKWFAEMNDSTPLKDVFHLNDDRIVPLWSKALKNNDHIVIYEEKIYVLYNIALLVYHKLTNFKITDINLHSEPWAETKLQRYQTGCQKNKQHQVRSILYVFLSFL